MVWPESSEREPSAAEVRRRTIEEWGLDYQTLVTLIAENPHVYSPVAGFFAEYKCRQLYLDRPEITDIVKPSGYEQQAKGDFVFRYKGEEFRIEVKCLDGPSVRRGPGDGWRGTFQCNASTARDVPLPNGRIIHTNCVVVGGWDVLAVSLYDFDRKWRFAFARQDELPRGSDHYAMEDRQFLLPSAMKVTWPLETPFTENLLEVLDAVLATRSGSWKQGDVPRGGPYTGAMLLLLQDNTEGGKGGSSPEPPVVLPSHPATESVLSFFADT
jgi:hypothetical protein